MIKIRIKEGFINCCQIYTISQIRHYFNIKYVPIQQFYQSFQRFIMNSNRKRKIQPSTPLPKRTFKVPKGSIQDIYPFEKPHVQRMSSQLKQYINELQREYIERYNVLMNNREVYSQVIQNISTELDGRGICEDNLKKVCEYVKIRESSKREKK